VTSFNGRTGAIFPQAGDYTAMMVTNAVSMQGTYADPPWITSFPWARLSGMPTTFTPAPHTHDATAIVSGVLSTARLGTGVADSTVYLRGDGTWAGVSGGGGGGAVISVFGRAGNVIAQAGDYTAAMVTGAVTDPTTVAGDLIVRNNLNALVRLPIGANGQVLQTDLSLSVRMKWTSIEASVQTPWVTNINAAGFNLFSVGRVGVGTASPNYGVDVVGDINYTGVFRQNGVPVTFGGSQTPWTSDINAGNFSLFNANRIGIQVPTTAATLAPIHAAAHTPGPLGQITVQDLDANAGGNPVLTMSGIGSEGTRCWMVGNPGGTPYAKNLYLWNDRAGDAVFGTNGAERMRILSNGMIGAGITNPGSMLEVAGTQPAFRGGSSASIRVRRIAADRASSLSLTGGAIGEMVIGVPPSSDDLVFGFENGSALLERVRLTSAGNLGINNPTPGATLHVRRGSDLIDTLSVSGADYNKYLTFQSGPSYGRMFHWNGSGYGGIVSLSPFGVGTTPGAQFHVSGGRSYFDSPDSFAIGVSRSGSSQFWIGTDTPTGNLMFSQVSGVERMRIQQNGYVGISQSNPRALLTVTNPTNPTSAAAANQITITEASNNPDYGLALGFFVDASYKGVIQATNGGPAGGILTLNPLGGYVSIGGASPVRTFQITGNAGAAGAGFSGGSALMRIEGTGAWSEPMLEFHEAGNSAPIACIAAKNTGGGAGDLIFLSRSSGQSSASERMRVLSSGGIRIGVNGPAITSGDLSVSRDAAAQTGATYFGNGGAYIFFDGTQFIFSHVTNKSGVSTIQVNGGTVATGATSLNFVNGVSSGAQWLGSGVTFNFTSDIRLKQNVSDLEGGLSVVDRLRPVAFEWNGLGGYRQGQKNVAVIAQELREVLPDCVYPIRTKMRPEDAEDTEILGYEPLHILFHLVLAVQQLEKRLKALEN
jgi:endosialidase-like protein